MKKFLVCVAVLLSTLCVQAQMGDSGERQIISLEEKWAQARKASDADAIAPMLANNFVIVFADGRLMNKAQALDDTEKSKMESVDASDLKVTSYGNTAVVTGIWKGKGPMPRASRRMTANATSIPGTSQLTASGSGLLPETRKFSRRLTAGENKGQNPKVLP